MTETTNSPVRRWHVIGLLVGVWIVAVGVTCFTWVMARDMVTPYRVPGSLTDAVEPRILSGNDAEVLTYCENHLAYHPDDFQARWYRAVALYRLGRKGEAEQEFRGISGVDTNWAEVVKRYPAWLKSDTRHMRAAQPTN